MIQTEVVNTFKYHISNEFGFPNPPVAERGFHQDDEWIYRRFNCSLKDIVLNTVTQNEGLKLSELFEKTRWDNYSSFKSEVSALCKKGYLVKSGKRRNYRYYITNDGRFHAENPTYELNNYYSKLKDHSEKLTLNGLTRVVRNMDDASLDKFVRTLMDSIDLDSLIEELASDEYFEMKSHYDSLFSKKQNFEYFLKLECKKNNSLQNEIADYKTVIDSLESNNDDLEKTIDELDAEIKVKGGELASYEKKMIEKDECVEGLKKSLESAHMKISELKDGIISDGNFLHIDLNEMELMNEEDKNKHLEPAKRLLINNGYHVKYTSSNSVTIPEPSGTHDKSSSKNSSFGKPSGHGGKKRAQLIKSYYNKKSCDSQFFKRLGSFKPYIVTKDGNIILQYLSEKNDHIVLPNVPHSLRKLGVLEEMKPSIINEKFVGNVIFDDRDKTYYLEYAINSNKYDYIYLQSQQEYNENLNKR